MEWQPGHGGGTGDGTGDEPDPGLPAQDAPVPGGAPRGHPRGHGPAGFAHRGEWDAAAPSAALAVALEGASGPGWRCGGASRDEMIGLLRQWQAVECWAAAGKLGVLRALIRDDDQPLPGGRYRGDLPEGWTQSLTHEVAAALAMSVVSAENLMWLAWDMQAALPGTGELLAAGDLTLAKARAVDQALGQLTDDDAADAEAMLLPLLGGKTYGQVAKLAAQAAITVDPESAARRREDAERTKCRVQVFREESGAAGLSGRDLPTDQTLAAHARVCERAAEYKDSGAFGEARMDQLRAAAYLDLINGITADARIASGQLVTVSGTGAPPSTANPDGAPPSTSAPAQRAAKHRRARPVRRQAPQRRLLTGRTMPAAEMPLRARPTPMAKVPRARALRMAALRMAAPSPAMAAGLPGHAAVALGGWPP